MPKTNKVVLAMETSGVAFDLADEDLGAKVVLDFCTGGHLHVTPHAGETQYDVLRRAHEAVEKYGHTPGDVSLCYDAELIAEGYDPEACLGG